MRILRITPSFASSTNPGSGTNSYFHSKYSKYKSYILTEDRRLEYLEVADNVRIKKVKTLNKGLGEVGDRKFFMNLIYKFFSTFIFTIKSIRFLHSVKPQIVHLYSPIYLLTGLYCKVFFGSKIENCRFVGCKFVDCDFQFTNGQQPVHITSYTPFGQDLFYNNENHTLNFAAETSTLLLEPIQNTLFSEYNFSYLYNLYNLKQRLVNVKTKLPTSILTSLKLNDRVIIRDKRYIINDMKSDLTSGEVDFSLYLDFRPMINTNIPIVEPNGGSVFLAFNIPNEGESIVLSPPEEVTLSESVLTTSQTITATVGRSDPNTFFTIDVTYNFKNGTTTNDTVSILSLGETVLLTSDSSRFTADQNTTIDQREGFPTR